MAQKVSLFKLLQSKTKTNNIYDYILTVNYT